MIFFCNFSGSDWHGGKKLERDSGGEGDTDRRSRGVGGRGGGGGGGSGEGKQVISHL